MSAVEKPLAFWTCMRDAGDNGWRGTTIHNHWGRISLYLNGASSTGILSNESCVDKLVDDENSESADDEDTTGNRPLVLKLCLRSAGSSSKKRVSLTRLDVVKQMFDAYINRLLAYNFQTHLGLITFSTRPSLSQEITHAVEEFRHKLNNMKASGDTAIWDSIALAQDQLQEYAKQYPTAKLRIICISDGEDNRSKNKGYILPASLLRNGIVLDSFCLGKGIDNADLKGISFLTGGYVFQPKSLEEAMAICEMEPVLSLFERPDKSLNGSVHLRNYLTNPGYYSFRMAEYMGKVEHVSRDEFPDRKQHPQLAESFVELGLFNRSSSISRTDSNVRLSRIHNEIRNSGAKPHPHYDIFICESNMGLWKIVMQGESTVISFPKRLSPLCICMRTDLHRTSRQYVLWWYFSPLLGDGRQIPDVTTRSTLHYVHLPSKHQPSWTHLPFDSRPQLDTRHFYQRRDRYNLLASARAGVQRPHQHRRHSQLSLGRGAVQRGGAAPHREACKQEQGNLA